jgi:hypothetical protein
MPLLGKAVLAWLVLLVAMMGNGFVRVLILQPPLGDDVARQVASLAGIAIVFAVATLFVRRIGGTTPVELVGVGLVWLALTVGFEFLFGHYGSGLSWRELQADYDLERGRLWVLVLLATLISPWLSARLLRAHSSRP